MARLTYALLAGTIALGGCIIDGDNDRGRGYPRYSSRDYDGDRGRGNNYRRYSSRNDSDFYSPRRGVVCNEDAKVCYRKGDPNRKATRAEFGKKAARRFDKW